MGNKVPGGVPGGLNKRLYDLGFWLFDKQKDGWAEKIGRLLCRRGYSGGYELLGVVLTEHRRLSEASECLVRGCEKFPQIICLWRLRGVVHSDLGEYSEAERCFQVCLDQGSEWEREQAKLNLAIMSGRKKEDAEACRWLAEISSDESLCSQFVRFTLWAEYAVRSGDVDGAKKAIREARRFVSSEGEGDICDLLEAWVAKVEGRIEESQRLVDRVRVKSISDENWLRIFLAMQAAKAMDGWKYEVIAEGRVLDGEGYNDAFIGQGWLGTFAVIADSVEDAEGLIGEVIPRGFGPATIGEIKAKEHFGGEGIKGVYWRAPGYTFFSVTDEGI